MQADVANFWAGLAGIETTEAFLPAVAPGTIEHWLRDEYYESDEAYLAVIVDAMKVEDDAIRRPDIYKSRTRTSPTPGKSPPT